jgi:FKBP-type peptidyl-prolyl cis-trans isomerase
MSYLLNNRDIEKDKEIESLTHSILKEGEGDQEVKEGDTITVHYRGWLAIDGMVFDESFNHGNDGFTFTVGEGVIKGWSEGVVGMKLNEVRRLKIPYDKGYGEYGAGFTIPPYSDLIFDVELLGIEK